MLWRATILLLVPLTISGIKADRRHDNWRKKDPMRILADETDKQDRTVAIKKHESWQETDQINNQLHKLKRKHAVDAQQRECQEIDSINIPADQQNEYKRKGRHESWTGTNSSRILSDEVESEKNGNGSYEPLHKINPVIQTYRQNENNRVERHESWRQKDQTTVLSNELGRKGEIQPHERNESWQKPGGIGILFDKMDRRRRDTRGIPDPEGAIQTLTERGLSLRRLSLRRLSLPKRLAGDRDGRKDPKYSESRCKRCLSEHNIPATIEVAGADSNLAAVSGTGQGIQRPNRRVKQRRTKTTRDFGTTLGLTVATLILCGCCVP